MVADDSGLCQSPRGVLSKEVEGRPSPPYVQRSSNVQ